MNFMDTVKGSLMENYYPVGWDMAKIDACCEKGVQREYLFGTTHSTL